MTDFRSEAEKFVTEFLDYIQTNDIQDHFDKQTQKMIRSPGVASLIKSAQAVFPPRAEDGKVETDKLSGVEVAEAIETSTNVVDRRDVFSRRVAANGAARGLLARVLAGDELARQIAIEFISAENGEKEFQ